MNLKALPWLDGENFSHPLQINGQSGDEGAVADGPDKLAISCSGSQAGGTLGRCQERALWAL